MVGLTFGVAVVVVVAFALGAYLYSSHHFARLVQAARATANAQADTILTALEHGMVEKDRTLIEAMAKSFAADPTIMSVMILDRQGRLQYSSPQQSNDDAIDRNSPTCRSCHERPPAQRARSRVFDTDGGAILRTVTPIKNRAE